MSHDIPWVPHLLPWQREIFNSREPIILFPRRRSGKTISVFQQIRQRALGPRYSAIFVEEFVKTDEQLAYEAKLKRIYDPAYLRYLNECMNPDTSKVEKIVGPCNRVFITDVIRELIP